MIVSFVMWNLRDSDQTVEGLRKYLREYAVTAYSDLEGMHLKAWFSSAEHEVWGAVYFWDEPEYIQGLFSISKAVELIGAQPSWVGHFSLEATALGKSVFSSLEGLGLALEGV